MTYQSTRRVFLAQAGLAGVELLETGGHPAVYGEWLGLSAEEIADLRNTGVI